MLVVLFPHTKYPHIFNNICNLYLCFTMMIIVNKVSRTGRIVLSGYQRF